LGEIHPASVPVFLVLFTFLLMLMWKRYRAGEAEQSQTEVHLQIRVSGANFPTPSELQSRYEVEDFVRARGLGRIVDAGSGMGVMDVVIATADPEKAESELKELVARLGIAERVTVGRR
jgi:hypothetical protein